MVDGQAVELGIAGLGPAGRIGSGGFADVYRAQQTNLRREVAVKVLRATAGDPQARMRFERECHAVGAVSGHPNIVDVFTAGQLSDDRPYLMLEYISGGTLWQRLNRDELTEEELHRDYRSTVDPRLNYGQALEAAMWIARHLREVRGAAPPPTKPPEELL